MDDKIIKDVALVWLTLAVAPPIIVGTSSDWWRALVFDSWWVIPVWTGFVFLAPVLLLNLKRGG